MKGLTRLGALVRKELRQAFRDPRMVWLLVGVPVLQLMLFGYVVDLEVDRLPTAVCDLDRSPTSRRLIAHFFADRTFVERSRTESPAEASMMLERGEAAAALVFPRGLARDSARGIPAQIQILVDGTDPVRARVAMAAAEQFFGREGVGRALAALERASLTRGVAPSVPTVQIEPRIFYNQRMKSPIFMVPGVVAAVLMIVTTLVTSMGIAREREMGTLEQVMVTPLNRPTYILGKILPYAMVGLIDVGLVITAGMYLFDVPVRGPLVVIVAASLLYLLSTLGVGLFISTVSNSQQQAILSGFFFTLPAILLSGFMTPAENMPEWIRPLCYANPMFYYLEILRGCMLKGSGFSDLSTHFLALAGFGGVIFTASSLRFRR